VAALGLTPLEAFLKKGIITDQFMELYTCSFVSLLIKMKIAKIGDEVLIGWDPRDKEGIFTDASVRGIRRAGGCAVSLGIIPTPALPVYMMYKCAKAGVMVTASHNPSDQNGIKLFLYPMGLKLFPEDEKILTEVIYKTDYDKIKLKRLSGELRDEHGMAVKVFLDFICDPRNSWIEKKNLLRDGVLIVDSANGSYSEIASKVFKRLGFRKVIDVNNNIDGEVNQNCGVSDINGVRKISPSMVFKKKGSPLPKYGENSTLKKIFKIGRIYRDNILAKKSFVSGAVFDADGDRFVRLEYDPLKDEILVLAGDEIAFIQGKYLIKEDFPKFKNSYYVNTVESDLQASLYAKELGFRIKSTGVGDKWLLANSTIEVLNSLVRFLLRRKDLKGERKIDEVRNFITKLRDISSISALRLVNIFKIINLYREVIGEEESRRWIDEISSNFAIGSEESGHNITAGFIEDIRGKLQIVFAGNGLKSALNTFASTNNLFWHGKRSCNDYIKSLRSPFAAGIKKTLYIYYTDKGKFFNGSKIWRDVKRITKDLMSNNFKNKVKLKTEIKREDPGLLYFSLIENGGKLRGAIFIRNSGTEDKTGVNIRGKKEDEDILSEIGERIAEFLRKVLKDYKNPCARIQRLIIEKVNHHRIIETNFLMNLVERELGKSPDLIMRVLMETEKKEGLIKRVIREKSAEDFYSITDRGKRWLEEEME